MEMAHTDIIAAPRDQVYRLVRDEFPHIAKYLLNVRRVECLSRVQESKHEVRLVNRWFAKVDIPAALQSFVSEDFFAWNDKALWNDTTHQVTYELESFVAHDLFSAKGSNAFVEHSPSQTTLQLRCSIEIHPEHIPGVPRLVARGIRPVFEKMIEKMLKPNMTSLGQALNQYLAEQKVS
jgi:hypothetical protein